jgi:hypothetical protein
VKRQLPGLLAALFLAWIFPSSEGLATAWSRAWSAGNTKPATADPEDERLVWAPLRATSVEATDTAPVSDPFHSEAAPSPAPASGSRSDLGVPPPPRPWRATGRVGERAAVLTNPDGRVLVVSDGAMVDSSRVISIGTTGIVLEDRAGQFTLKIP